MIAVISPGKTLDFETASLTLNPCPVPWFLLRDGSRVWKEPQYGRRISRLPSVPPVGTFLSAIEPR
ncbi:hypothetical protein N8703_03400, partial [Verrucomicrobia bacterium]|nr:hypothetical protein [Verrucomicrobiota bacterium]